MITEYIQMEEGIGHEGATVLIDLGSKGELSPYHNTNWHLKKLKYNGK